MPVTTYILSIDDFTSRQDLSKTIKQTDLQQYFGITQERYATKMLCQKTYEELIDQLSQGGEAYLTPEYQALLPFLKDYLVYKTMARYYANANYKSTTAGIRAHTDTISVAPTVDAMKALIDQAKQDAEYYRDQLQNFLIKNQDDYPLWKESNCYCGGNFTKGGGGQIRFGKNRFNKTVVKWT